MPKRRVLIMGAAGRDFHNFNVYFRQQNDCHVVAFTATQIPNIENRRYPSELAGPNYPQGIPIYAESELTRLIKDLSIDEVIFAYSDVSHELVMHKASQVLAAGANFTLMGTASTMLKSTKPVVAVCAVRTGAGKSQTTRRVTEILQARGHKIAVVRHPMPYGNLVQQAVQRFASYADLENNECTLEEREEYEPHLERGVVVFAGVDYEQILRKAEAEADIVIWDGGNNDFPFFKPDLLIVVADPHRAGQEISYHPGETNLRLADVVIINKIDTADAESIRRVRENTRRINPSAIVIDAASPITVENPDEIFGKTVLVVEDGPTLTHGEMTYGAGVVAAQRFGAKTVVDPRPHATGTLLKTYANYPKTGNVLPAMGYGEEQIADLEKTINSVPCDLVIIATPVDLTRVVNINRPVQRVRYELQEIGRPTLADVLGSKFS